MPAAIALPPSSLPSNGSAEIHTLEETEQEAIAQALRKYNGNRKLAAEALGISERTLYRKLPKQSGHFIEEGNNASA